MQNRLWNKPIQRASPAFTLVEIIVSVLVLTIIVLGLGQVMSHGIVISRTGNKHIDTDTQARAVLDRMAVDFAQMLKRTDVDYYVKGPGTYKGHGNGHAYGQKVQAGQQGSDQIAFFSQVPGYNDPNGSSQSLLQPL